MYATLDHLVLATPDLAATVADFHARTGIRPSAGGRHPDRGTHNALVHLGGRAYLEFIAADPDNADVPPPRWMGVDLVTAPTYVRWAVRAQNLSAARAALGTYDPALAQSATGRRTTPAGAQLSWSMSLPRPAPAVEPAPFVIDWSASAAHPTDGLVDHGLRLHELRLSAPRPRALRKLLAALGVGEVPVAEGPPRIRVAFAPWS